MSYTTVEEVQQLTGIKPSQLHLPKSDESEEELAKILTNWITQAEDLINKYCNNPDIIENPPSSVCNVCLRLVSNMVAFAIARRDTPVIKVDDWNVQMLSSEIFSQDLKQDLYPFKIDHSNNSKKIEFFAITGDDEKW